MKLLLIPSLIAMVLVSQDTATPQNVSDLVVLKFSWSKSHMPAAFPTLQGTNDGILVAQIATDPHVNRTTPRSSSRREDPERIVQAASIQSRTGDLGTIEQSAALPGDKAQDVYIYRIQVKNTGEKEVKSFIWEYQTPSSSRGSIPRQFLCRVRIKPNDTKGLQVLSPFAPSKVIAAANSKGNQQPRDNVTMNWIQYSDGFTWQRTYWEDPTAIPAIASLKVTNGRCVGL